MRSCEEEAALAEARLWKEAIMREEPTMPENNQRFVVGMDPRGKNQARNEEKEQRTRELLLDRTEISPIHSLDQLCLVERKDLIANGEQRHLTRVSEFCATFNK